MTIPTPPKPCNSCLWQIGHHDGYGYYCVSPDVCSRHPAGGYVARDVNSVRDDDSCVFYREKE